MHEEMGSARIDISQLRRSPTNAMSRGGWKLAVNGFSGLDLPPVCDLGPKWSDASRTTGI